MVAQRMGGTLYPAYQNHGIFNHGNFSSMVNTTYNTIQTGTDSTIH